MRNSEQLESKLKQLNSEKDSMENEIYENGGRLSPLLKKYKDRLYGIYSEIRSLEKQIMTERNRELDVGDGCTYHLWSDAHACTVIKKTAKTITIQRDKAILDSNFKAEWISGGFAAHCTNADEQSYTYERDEKGEVMVCHWSEKEGRYRSGSDGSIKISVGRYEFYDYNF